MRLIATVLAAALLGSVLPTTASAQSVAWTTQGSDDALPIYLDEKLTIFTNVASGVTHTVLVDLTAFSTNGTATTLWEQTVACDQSPATGSVFRLSPSTLGVVCESTPLSGTTIDPVTMLYTLNHANGSVIRSVPVHSVAGTSPATVEAAGAVCVQPSYLSGAMLPWCVLSTGSVLTLPRLDQACPDTKYLQLYVYNTTLAASTVGCGVGTMSFFDLLSGALLGNVTSAPFLQPGSESSSLFTTVRQDGQYVTSLVRPSGAGAYVAVLVVDLQLRTGATSQLSMPPDVWPSTDPTNMYNFVAGHHKATDSLVVGLTGLANITASEQNLWLWSVSKPAQRGEQPAAVSLNYTEVLPETGSWAPMMQCQLGAGSSLLFCASAHGSSSQFPPSGTTPTYAAHVAPSTACPLAGPVVVLRVADGSTVYAKAWGAAANPSLVTTLPNGVVVTGNSVQFEGITQCISTFNATSGQPLWTTEGYLVGPGAMWAAPGCIPVGRSIDYVPSVACIADSP